MAKHYLNQIWGYLRYFLHSWIMIDGYIKFKDGHVIHNNVGDDINIPLLESLTGKKVIHISQSKLWRIPRLLCIGSIIEDYCNQKSIIWGSGCMYGNRPILTHPQKVCAVRGRYTRKVLIGQGIYCPEVFGDPALLLPYIYTPHTKKKYEYGFIPHVLDFDIPHVKSFREKHTEILFIKIKGYKSWTDVIEQINSCKYIISSSLHGLIISDAYGIPNVRVVFSDYIGGGDFKYKDYYSGINKEYTEAIDCKKDICLEKIEKQLKTYKAISYDPRELLKAFPFKLNPKFIKLVNGQ